MREGREGEEGREEGGEKEEGREEERVGYCSEI